MSIGRSAFWSIYHRKDRRNRYDRWRAGREKVETSASEQKGVM